MSRNRVGSSKPSAAENEQMTHLWHSLVDTLRLLPSLPTNPSSLMKLSSSGANEEDKPRDLRILQNEKRTLDEALEKLGILIALRRGSSVPPDSASALGFGLASGSGPGAGNGAHGVPGFTVSTPTSGTGASAAHGPGSGGPGGIKRKRKSSFGNGGSASPAPSLLLPNSRDDTHSHRSLSPGPAGHKPSTPMSREATGKHRRELYFDQLPLQPDRKVAFKLARQKVNEDDPSSGTSGGAGAGGGGSSGGSGGGGGGVGGGGDDWILATIKKCIQQDRMRYEVQDIDDGNKYNTTLRSIIPLPDPKSAPHLSSNPLNLEDYPKDTQVLALYPDTTSFYRATVISAPLPGTGMGLGLRSGVVGAGAKKGSYRLMFVDDDEKIHEVDKNEVLAYPS